MMKRRKQKASPEKIAEILRQIREGARPEEWPTFGMTKEEVIEHCRKTRERLWEEKMARHASRSTTPPVEGCAVKERHPMMKRRKQKASPEKLAEILRQIREGARPEEWPTFGMTDEEVIEHCRKTRERLWEEKMARHATGS